MKASVIVCTYSNELYNDTLRCIDSIQRQNYADKEILLVLDRNEDLYCRYRDELEDVRILVNDAQGLSNARNLGIKNSTGEIIVFIDDDAYAGESYLENLIQNYEDNDVLGSGGKVLPQEKTSYPDEIYWVGGFTYKGYPEEKCNVRNLTLQV